MNDVLMPPQLPAVKPADYRVLSGKTPDEVAEKVTTYIQQGYQPAGPLLFNPNTFNPDHMWMVPVVLTEAEQLRISMIKLQQEATIQQQGMMAEQINIQMRAEARANKLMKQAGQMGTVMEDGSVITIGKAEFALLLSGLALHPDSNDELVAKIKKLHDTCPEE